MLTPEKVKELYKVISIAFKWRFVVSTPNRRSFLSLPKKYYYGRTQNWPRCCGGAVSSPHDSLIYFPLRKKRWASLTHKSHCAHLRRNGSSTSLCVPFTATADRKEGAIIRGYSIIMACMIFSLLYFFVRFFFWDLVVFFSATNYFRGKNQWPTFTYIAKTSCINSYPSSFFIEFDATNSIQPVHVNPSSPFSADTIENQSGFDVNL